MARLRIEFRGAETVVSLAHGETSVGRSNRCTIHLPDPELAPVHFRIRDRSKGFQLKDDGSGVGTHVNGKPVFAATLRHGDVIEAGGLRCTFLSKADAPAPPPREIPTAPRAPEAKPANNQTKRVLTLGVIAAVVIAAAIFYVKGSNEKEAEALWREANTALSESSLQPDQAQEKLREAADLLERIGVEHGQARVASMAMMALNDARRTLKSFDDLADLKKAVARAPDGAAADDLFLGLARLKKGAHPAIVRSVENLEEELKQSRTARAERVFADRKAAADALLEKRDFAGALRAWVEFESADYLYRQRAETARVAVERRIRQEYGGVLKLAGRSAELEARIGLLEASRPVFKGTPQADDLEVRISALRARRAQRRVVVINDPSRKKTPTKKTDTPTEDTPPEEVPPYEDPPKVVELLKARRYAEAASMLNSITRHPDAKVRLEELTLLASLMADLVAAVQANPATFENILLPHRVGRGDAAGADAKFLRITKDGKEARYAWESLPAKSFTRLFRLASFNKPPRLATALFFDEEALVKDAQRDYVAFFRSEQTPQTLTRILARRRGIEPPRAGFQLFRGRLLTVAERDDLLLKEQIEKLAKQARSTLDKRRRAAWIELEKLGEPAVETLAAVLKERRTQVVGELMSSKAFSSQRFAVKLGAQLRERRKGALAYILDPNRYPYPNKTDAAQKEAERLVDLVREIYEHPYNLLLATSDSAQALGVGLKELDERVARADPLAEAVLEGTVEKIERSLDADLVALDSGDQKRIDYNQAVMKYNRELKDTTADEEERANVTAVNKYRWMMGLHAVKIDERLVRGSRKHSIEMRQRGYFAHDSPTPHLKSPGQRAKREGYKGGVSENIARGAATGVQAFWQWFRSSGHHRNMLVPGHAEMGCGAAKHHWWTQMFGRATGKSLQPPKVPPDPDPPGTSGNGDPAPGA